ncbi:MAG: LLM class flavin-dependent oxidoreductase [Pseudomonadota bacterium]
MTVGAGIGIANFNFDDAAGFWRWVDLCESGGVDSIWQSDRLISRDPQLECLSTMAALAGRTKRLKFGMNVASLGWRDPVLTAKTCATIDFLSDGRMLPAFGVGSARSRDFVATGKPTAKRGARTDEAIQILTELWRDGECSFQGEHYQLRRASIAPQPVQQPLPLWLGGSARAAIERTARWGTGWQAGIESPEEIAPVIAAIKARTSELGRAIDEDHFGAGFAFRFGPADHPVVTAYERLLTERLGKQADGFLATGDADSIMALLDRFHAAGAHKFVLRPMASGTEDVLEQTRLMIDQLLPAIARYNQPA